MADIDSAKQRILSQVPLVDLVEKYIPVKRASSRFSALCPFHKEKSPSFTIYNDHYYCFGCKARGDAIDFVRHQHGCGFIDALKILAEKYGIELPELEENPAQKAQHERRSRLYRVTSAAEQHFISNLKGPNGRAGRQYLVERGFSEESIDAYHFGFAEDSFQTLIEAMSARRIGTTDLLDCSLAATSAKSGRAFDFFRGRLMIPIRDGMGRVCAFGGRTLGDELPKYINSRESNIYEKGKILFGLYEAKEHMRNAGYAIVTEGYMDTLQLWNAGIKNVVACLGTALTKQQLSAIEPFCKKVVLIFDGDRAGEQASLRTVATSLEVSQLDIRVVCLPEGEDPDSFVRAQGPEAMVELSRNAPALLDFAIKHKFQQTPQAAWPDIIRDEFVPWLAKVHDSLQRQYLIHRISKTSSVPADFIQSMLRQIRSAGTRQSLADKNPQPDIQLVSTKMSPEAFDLLGNLFYAEPSQELQAPIESLINRLEWHPALQRFAQSMAASLAAGMVPAKDPQIMSWESVQGPAMEALVDRLRGRESAFVSTDSQSAFKVIANRLKRKQILQHKTQLKSKLAVSDHDEQVQLLKQISDINKELNSLE